MKKIILISILFSILFFSTGVHAQFRYKVEYAIEVNTVPSGQYNVGFSLADFANDTSGPGLFSFTVTDSPQGLETYFLSEENIVNSPRQYSGMRRRVSQSGFTTNRYFDFCDITTGTGSNIAPTEVYVYRFNIILIESLATVNNYSTTSSVLPECEDTFIRIANNSCGSISYGVQYQVGSSSTWQTLHAYGRRSTSFGINRSLFSGLDNFENVRIRVQYDNTTTPTYSDVLTYSFVPCPPNLSGSPVVENTSCSDSNDGGFRVSFDRDLEADEEFRFTLSGVTPGGFTIPESDYRTQTTSAGNTVIWPDGLGAGTYTLTYQTFFLQGNSNPSDDVPTSVGTTANFTISAPSAVTISSPTVTQPVCFGETGTVTVSAAGGQNFESGSYQYSRNNGASWQNSGTFTGLTQGQTYTFRSRLVLSGGRSCVSPGNRIVTINTINSPLSINDANAAIQPSFLGATDGSIFIRLNGTGGTAPFRYEARLGGAGGTVASSASGVNNRSTTLTNLGVGTYTIRVVDANGCNTVFPTTIVLSAPPLLVIDSIDETAIRCFNDANGELTVNPSGGNASNLSDYRYRWSKQGDAGFSSTTRVITGLTAGIYTVEVTDTRNDFSNPNTSASATVTLNNPTQVQIVSAVAADIRCNGSADGNIRVTASGGTLPYEYQIGSSNTWIPVGSGATSWNIPITSFGFYSLSIRDANQCTVANPNDLFIDEPEAITIAERTVAHVDNTIAGGNAGVLEITIANNVGVTSYNWTRNGTAFTPPAGSSDTRLVGLLAGSYSVSVVDANGCTGSLSTAIEITEPGPLVITNTAVTNVSCNAAGDGSIDITVTGGITPYSYSWDNGETTEDISSLPPGVYTVTVTDVAGATTQTTATITEPAVLSLSHTQENNICFGSSQGSIDVTVNGGTAPYTYSWDNGATTQDLSNLASGSYIVNVIDANGCPAILTVTITSPEELVLTQTITPIIIFGGANGAIDISISGGTTNYNYQWSSTTGFSSTEEDITGLSAGTYTVVVRDENYIASGNESGCELTASFVLSEPGPLVITDTAITNVSCNGVNDGSVDITITGGVEPYSYNWDNGETTEDINDLSPGVYNVTVTDASGVTAQTNATITEPEVLSLSHTQENNICFGSSQGSIDVSVSGGTAPYMYSWNTGATTEDLSDLASGTYIVDVIDANGCLARLPVTITSPEELILTSTVTQITAFGAADGAIAITVSGGTTGYSYQWSSTNGFTSTDEDLTNLAPGTYTVVIQDENYSSSGNESGCELIASFEISEPDVLIVTITEEISLLCYGDTDGALMATVSGGVTPYRYEWFQLIGGTSNTTGKTEALATNLASGDYQVVITDANDITIASATYNLTEPQPLVIDPIVITDVLCFGDATGAIDISISGGVPPYTINWDTGATTEDISGIPSGSYYVLVEDSNNCIVEQVIEVMDAYEELMIASEEVINVSSYEGSDGSISIVLIGGLEPYTINWTRVSDGANLGSSIAITNLIAGDYEVAISDVNSCTINRQYTLTQPDIVEAELTNPTCVGDCDGRIELLVNKGNGSFSYSWSTGATTRVLNNLCAGSYTVTVTGFGNGPLERTYILEDPEPVIVDLGDDKILCVGQQVAVDGSIDDTDARYQWSSDTGFSSDLPGITITETGNYTLTVTTSEGCIGSDSIYVESTTDEISAEFAVSSQVFTGESVIAIDISYPLPEEVEWMVPEGGNVLNMTMDELEVVFDTAGEYAITMMTRRGDCVAMQTKTVLVVERDSATGFDEADKNDQQSIKDFIVYPNPTDGRFTADVEMNEQGNVSIKVFRLANNVLITNVRDSGKANYSIPMDISTMPAGLYAVLLETPYGNALRKVVLK